MHPLGHLRTVLSAFLLASRSLPAVGIGSDINSLGGLPLKPRSCVLKLNGHAIQPVRFGSGNPLTVQTQEGELTVEGSHVSFVERSGAKWSVTDGLARPAILACGEGVAYLTEWDNQFERSDSVRLTSILRLDLKTGKWEPPVMIPNEGKSVPEILAMTSSHGRLALLDQYADLKGGGPVARISVLEANSLRPLWSVDDSRPDPLGGYIPRDQESGQLNFKAIQWVQDQLIVCTSVGGPLSSFDGKGKLNWKLERPWEFVRKFVGPSVYQYFLDRSPSPVVHEKIEAHSNLNTVVDESVDGQILAGPIWIPNTAGHVQGEEDPGGRFVLSVFVRPKRFESTGDCMLYEISPDGKPFSRVPLSQYPLGGNERAVSGGIVWPCTDGSFVRVGPPHEVGPMMEGPFFPADLTTRLKWFSQTSPREVSELLRTQKFSCPSRTDSIAYTPTKAIRIDEGWTCSASEGAPLVFPVTVVDLVTGSQQSYELYIPVSTKVPAPFHTNYASVGGHTAILEANTLEVRRLEVNGINLRVFFKGEKGSAWLDFPLPKGFF